jgi:hypothetical protein
MYMIFNDFSSIPMIGRVVPRVGVSLALAASLFGAGQIVVRAEGLALGGITADVDGATLPFIVCGVDTRLQSGGHQSILLSTGGGIDPAAIGRTFQIHGSSVANCGAGHAFKGVADRTANAGSLSLPAGLSWLEGDRAGPTSDEMEALNCFGRSSDGCTMLVPIATGADSGQLQTVALAVMQVTITGPDSHSGQLLGDSSTVELRRH